MQATSVSKNSVKQPPWESLILGLAAFWLSGSLLLDFLIMPMMYGTGMMQQPGFASAGYGLFWLFNRIEILCAATLITGLLALRQPRRRDEVVMSGSRSRWALGLALGLFAIALLYTYELTPTMSGLGLHLSDTDAIPAAMNWMHALYWICEGLKLLAVGVLLRLCYQDVTGQFTR